MKIPKYLMKDKVEVVPFLGESGGAGKVAGSSYFQMGKLEEKMIVVKTDKGVEHVWQGEFFTDKSIPVRSEVVLESRRSRVIQCAPVKGFSGKNLFYEVLLK